LDEPNLIAESHRTQDMDADFKPWTSKYLMLLAWYFTDL
jgi:hypothetical protein